MPYLTLLSGGMTNMRKLKILHITTFLNWRSTQLFHPIVSLAGHAIGVEAMAFRTNILVAKEQ